MISIEFSLGLLIFSSLVQVGVFSLVHKHYKDKHHVEVVRLSDRIHYLVTKEAKTYSDLVGLRSKFLRTKNHLVEILAKIATE